MEQQLNCLIVEDEPLAAEIIKDYVSQISFLNLIGICEDAIYASDLLKREQVDVLFLDIHLPKLRGLDFLKTLNQAPQVILTTAYQQYALSSYEFNVVDYLLKPIEFARFLQAVNKLVLPTIAHSPTPPQTQQITAPISRPFHFFNVNKERIKVYFDEIDYIESIKEYVKIHTGAKSIITKLQLNEILAILPEAKFIRIHRSYIIALDQVNAYTQVQVTINNHQLPIGRSYREEVIGILDGLAG